MELECFEMELAWAGEELFSAGSEGGVRGSRRKRLFGLVSKFRLAAAGKDPEPSEEDWSGSEEDVEEAARRLVRRSQAPKRKRRVGKGNPDPRREIPDILFTDQPTEEAPKSKKKRKGKKTE